MTGLPTWGSGQPGQVGNQAALTVEPVLGSRLVNFLFSRIPLLFLLTAAHFRHQQLGVHLAVTTHFRDCWALAHGFEVVSGW